MAEERSAHDWLTSIRNHPDKSLLWLWNDNNQSELFKVIRWELNANHPKHDVFDLLILVFPVFMQHYLRYDEWTHLLRDALVTAQRIQDIDLQASIYRSMGDQFLQQGNPTAAREMFESGMEYAARNEYREMIVALYAGLFRMQWFSFQDEFTPRIIQSVLDESTQIDNKEIRLNLHDALAFGYLKSGDTIPALEHAQTALTLATMTGKPQFVAQMALTLSVIYTYIAVVDKIDHCLKVADKLLKYSRSLVKTPELGWQYFGFAYQTGVQHLQRGKNRSAVQFLRRAVSEASDRNDYLAASKHALALAQTQLNLLDDARTNLVEAVNLWEAMNNQLERASALQGLAYLEYLAGQYHAAIPHLHHALVICEAQPANSRREILIKLILETMDEVNQKLQ
jgi:tetratricopeptide (TPR) repeat protein